MTLLLVEGRWLHEPKNTVQRITFGRGSGVCRVLKNCTLPNVSILFFVSRAILNCSLSKFLM